MIGKVTKGNGVQKLLWYLWGPGRANEHIDPHLIAAWGGPGEQDLSFLEPSQADGRPDVRPLARLLEQPLAAQTRPPAKAVWQCSLRLAPGDRPLTDAEWERVAREVMHRTGFAPREDEGGCRWVAMRHGPDHIHLAVVLARQDGQPVNTRNDFYKLGQACRDLEVEYDLRRTAARDRTGPRRPSRAELEKAQRAGKPLTARDELRVQVRLAAAAADCPGEFFDRLREQGVMVRLRCSQQDPGVVTGYSVAWPGDHTADGKPVWFGGSKLAADLSWTRLVGQWDGERPQQLAVRVAPDPALRDVVEAVARAVPGLLWHGSPGSGRSRESRQLERAAMTLLLAIAGRGGHRGRLGALTTTIALRDRGLPAPPPAPPTDVDVRRLLVVTRLVLASRLRGQELRRLARAAQLVLGALDDLPVVGELDRSDHVRPAQPGAGRPRSGRGRRGRG